MWSAITFYTSHDVYIFLRNYMCSNGYTINIDMSIVFIKIYKYIKSFNISILIEVRNVGTYIYFIVI